MTSNVLSLENVLGFVYCFVDFLVLFFFVDRLVRRNSMRVFIKRGVPLALGFGVGLTGILHFFNLQGYAKLAVLLLLLVIGAKFLFKISWMQNISLSLIALSLFCAIDFLIAILFSFLFYDVFLNPPLPIISIIPQVVGKLLFVIVATILTKFGWKNSSLIFSGSIDSKEWLTLAYFPLIALLYAYGPFLTDFYSGPTRVDHVVILVLLCAIAPAAFTILQRAVTREQDRTEALLMRQKANNELANYAAMNSLYENQRKLHHDYLNQLRSVGGLIVEGKTGKAAELIESITGKFSTESYIIHTNNPIIDTIVNQKYLYAKEHGISLTITANDLSNIPIKDNDLIVILTNVLDNAIEACQKIDGSRVIRLKLQRDKNELIISTRNPAVEVMKLSEGDIITSKKDAIDHGIGLKNVSDAVNKYGGSCATKYSDGAFFFSAIIPVKP